MRRVMIGRLLVAVLMMTAGLVAAMPAEAATTTVITPDGVRVTLTMTGRLTIVGTAAGDGIIVVPGEEGEPGEVGEAGDGAEMRVFVLPVDDVPDFDLFDPQVPPVLTGEVGSITVLGRAGDDAVLVVTDDLPGNVLINTGHGVDDVLVFAERIDGRLSVITGTTPAGVSPLTGTAGSRVQLQADVGRDVVITGGRGDEVFVAPERLATPRSLRIRTGPGSTQLFIEDADLGRLDYRGSSGPDVLDLANVGVGNAIVNTGGGADEVTTNQVTATGTFRMLTGAGDDTVRARDGENFTPRPPLPLVLNTAGGNDSVELSRDSIAAGSSFNGGPGDQDSLFFDEALAGLFTHVNFELVGSP